MTAARGAAFRRKKILWRVVVCLGSAVVFGSLAAEAGQDKPEVMSLLGRPLFAQPATGKELKKLQTALTEAAKAAAAQPADVDACIAHGKALAGLWRYHDAIAVYSDGIAANPGQALLYRHRGHRFLSVREFDKAVVDLETAAELDDKNFDIWYHLALAYYLQGEFGQAATAYLSCLAVAADDDSRIAALNWAYISHRRSGMIKEADLLLLSVFDKMKVVENGAYYELLKLYKGWKTEAAVEAAAKTDLDRATLLYGLGCRYLYTGYEDKAVGAFKKVVELPSWPAFGFIAAEAELARMKK